MKHNDIVTIELDRPREMHFRHKEMKQLQALYGVDPEQIDTRSMSAKREEQIMHIMLQRDAQNHGQELKLSDMEELLDYARPGTILRKINACLIAAFGPDEDPAAEGLETENPTTAP